MIDVYREDLIDLSQAAKEPPLRNPRTRKPAHLASLYRYILHGAKAANGDRVRLETIRTPRGQLTSREAIARFIAALTDPDAPRATPTQARRRQEQAERELTAAGFELGNVA